jgi:hypothetical protein
VSKVKEPQFFLFANLEKCDLSDLQRSIIKNIEYPRITKDCYLALFEKVDKEKAIGEATTTYLGSRQAAENIQRYIPSCKLIVVLRDPIERAYASFWAAIAQGIEPISDFLLACDAPSTPDNRRRYREEGFYYKHLSYYFEIFSSQQIKIYFYEDLLNRPLWLLQDIFRFLGVDDSFKPYMNMKYGHTGIPRNRLLNKLLTIDRGIKLPIKALAPQWLKDLRMKIIYRNLYKLPLLPEYRRRLIEIYRGDIEKLENLVQRDLGKWLT